MSTWIFLRGLTRESRHWADFPDIFRSEIRDAKIVTLDLPGNGDLNHMQSSTSVAAMAEYCHSAIEARGISPPYHVLAMSLGAMVAVALAMNYPREIGGCVLISTSLRPISPFYERLRPRNYPSLLRLVLPGCSVRSRESTILRITSNMAKSRAQILENWCALQRKHPVSRVNALRQLWASSRYNALPQRPPVRLLLLASEKDNLVSIQCSRRLARLWRTDLAIHPSAGHDIPLDDGAWVAQQVRQWLRRE